MPMETESTNAGDNYSTVYGNATDVLCLALPRIQYKFPLNLLYGILTVVSPRGKYVIFLGQSLGVDGA
jgi:hypothetical protein